MSKTGVLLVNLGTPDSPKPGDVGRYLREFLMDPLVIDIPAPLRWMLVNVLIVPRRRFDSAKLYEKVWMQEGSPLLVHTAGLAKKVQEEMGTTFEVAFGMRYGAPSLASALQSLSTKGISKLVVLPLYPQYSLAATESSVQKVKELAAKICPAIPLSFISPFYSDDGFLNASAQKIRDGLVGRDWDMLLLSFHGLPERQVKKTDPTGQHCVCNDTCCDAIVEANKNCYRAQCYATARSIATRLNLDSQKYRVGFQSRLKGSPWIQPFSDEYYRTLSKFGIKRLAVACPSFVADCLETLEEVQMRGEDEFKRHGGKSLFLIPCLNSDVSWAKAVSRLIRGYQPRT